MRKSGAPPLFPSSVLHAWSWNCIPECLEKSLLLALVPNSKFLQQPAGSQMWVPSFTDALWEREAGLYFSLWRTGFGYTVWNLPFTLKIYQSHWESHQEGTGYKMPLEPKWWEQGISWKLSSNQRHRSSPDAHWWPLKFARTNRTKYTHISGAHGPSDHNLVCWEM